jgi:hypothetical protein
MGSVTSSKRRPEQAPQAYLVQPQANVNRLRLFLPIIAAGLDSEGDRYAQRAIGLLVAIAGWPSLVTFVDQIGSLEYDIARITNEEQRQRHDRAIAGVAADMLLKAYAEPVTHTDVQDMQTIACVLMAWWGLSGFAEPQHPIVPLMAHFGGHPFKSNNLQAIDSRYAQIRSRITPKAQEVWKQAERAMSIYSNDISAASGRGNAMAG